MTFGRTILVSSTAIWAGLAVARGAHAQSSPNGNLQQQIQQLQLQLQALQQQVQANQDQAKKAQDDAAAANAAAQKAAAAPSVVKTSSNRFLIESADGQYSIGLTGRLQFDVGSYLDETRGRGGAPALTSPNFASGVDARRARLGVTGKLAGDWTYAFIMDFGGQPEGTAVIESGEVTYNGIKGAAIDLGYQDTMYGLEEAQSSNDIMFLERASAVNVATGIATGDNRSAAGIRFFGDRYWIGAYGTGPASTKQNGAGNQWGGFGRATYQVLQSPDYSWHVGGGVQGLFKAAGSPQALSLSDFPELRVDSNGLKPLATPKLGSLANPITGATTYNFETAGGWQNLFAQAEYYRYEVDRRSLPTNNFDGAYAEASWTITGESRKYLRETGAYSGIRPEHPFSPFKGDWGALELALRWSYVNLNDQFVSGAPSVLQPAAVNGGRQTIYTAGMNWYLNNNMRFMLDYLHGSIAKETSGTGAAGHPNGVKFDAIALRTQIAW